MRIKLSVILIFMIVSGLAYCQSYSFKVLGTNGDNSVLTGNHWVALKTGSVIGPDATVKVGIDAYLGLLHSSGRTLELRTEGEYTVKDLEDKLQAGSGTIASKYADFILSKITNPSTNNNKMSVTGAVERSAEKPAIKAEMPSSAKLFGPTARISWNKAGTNSDYVVEIKDLFNDVLLEKTISQPEYMLNIETPVFKDQKLLIFSVKVKDDDSKHSDDYSIKMLTQQESKPISRSLDSLKSEIGDSTSLDKLIIAAFFEKKDLMLNAATYYQAAIKMSPEVEDFKTVYRQFLERNGLGG